MTRHASHIALLAAAAACAWAAAAPAASRLAESRREFEGRQRTIVTMENDRIVVEVVPDAAGRIITYKDKTRKLSAFEWLDDCPYNYGCRWEGKPFTHKVGDRGPQRASVTVLGGGNIAVAHLRNPSLGLSVANPLQLAIERTMSIDAASTRLRTDVKVTNVGDGVAPAFRYMVHAVFGQVPHMPQTGMYWFLPTSKGIELFDGPRGRREMGLAAGGAPVGHPFNRFVPGQKSPKPRYEPGGWAAILTSAGPTYLFYDPAQFAYYQYWYGGDAEWHYTFEPTSRFTDLKPGESVTCGFTLAYDSADVPFTGSTVVVSPPEVPLEVAPGNAFPIRARATTVRDRAEKVALRVRVTDPTGKDFLTRDLAGEVTAFQFADLTAECSLPADAAVGKYKWTTTYADGRALAAGEFEVVAAEELAKRRMDRATAQIKADYEERIKDLSRRMDRQRKMDRQWREGANLALSLRDATVWPDQDPPAGSVSFAIRRGVVDVLGQWKSHETPRITALAAAPLPAWPDDPEAMLARLGRERAAVRDVAPLPSGKELAVLLVDRQARRVQVAVVDAQRVVRRFGSFADQPKEDDDRLGLDARALAVDADGNLWVATNAWGEVSVYEAGPDGQPSERLVPGPKGAVKKFSPQGKLLGSVSLLAAPMDLAAARADGKAVLLASYRSVSAYHGAQVREGTMVIRPGDLRRVGEIKAPAGSICVDEAGRLWTADVAGHVACFGLGGAKHFDVSASAPAAVPDATLPPGAPVSVVLRADGRGTVWALNTLSRRLTALDATGKVRADPKPVPETAGALHRLRMTPAGPLVIGERTLWRP